VIGSALGANVGTIGAGELVHWWQSGFANCCLRALFVGGNDSMTRGSSSDSHSLGLMVVVGIVVVRPEQKSWRY
jgi:hypothetical protein